MSHLSWTRPGPSYIVNTSQLRSISLLRLTLPRELGMQLDCTCTKLNLEIWEGGGGGGGSPPPGSDAYILVLRIDSMSAFPRGFYGARQIVHGRIECSSITNFKTQTCPWLFPHTPHTHTHTQSTLTLLIGIGMAYKPAPMVWQKICSTYQPNHLL